MWGDDNNSPENNQERDTQDEQLQSSTRKAPICRYFSTRRGCAKGDSCVFSHEQQVCAFFKTATGCTNDRCGFVHDLNKTSTIRLRRCPTPECSNQCLGQICQACHNKIRQRSESPHRRQPKDPAHNKTRSSISQYDTKRKKSQSPKRRARSTTHRRSTHS